MASSPFTNLTRLSQRIYKVVEDDRFGQFPFLYVIVGDDKCILIDTGCGTSNYQEFVSTRINKTGLPYLIINTHVHFDHVGGNYQFEQTPGFLGVCMSGRAKTFTQNYELNSLALAHPGCSLKQFNITRWLEEGDLIYLNDADPNPDRALRVIFTPGHTPDSLALYLPSENRLFIGDSVYPWTAIHVDCLGSSPKEYFQSIETLVDLIDKIQAELIIKGGPPLEQPKTSDTDTSTSSSSPPPSAPSDSTSTPPSSTPPVADIPASAPTFVSGPDDELRNSVISQFYSALGLVPYQARETFDVNSLLEISDWDLESAIETYISNIDSIGMLCPPVPQSTSTSTTTTSTTASQSSGPEEIPPVPDELAISCGHVSENLPASAVREIQQALIDIKAGEIPPMNIDDGIAEYHIGDSQYTLLLPFEAKWND